MELEALAIVVLDRRPRHLAHHVIAQIGRQVSDTDLSRTPRRRARQRVAVHVPCRRVVCLRALQQQLGLDVEIQQQVEELLERIGELDLACRVERLVAKSVEIALETGEVAGVLAHFERLHGERQRARTALLEAPEIVDPSIDAAGVQQHLAQIPVSGDARRIARDHVFVRRARGIRRALALEHDAEIEIGVDEVRTKSERALVRARGVGVALLHLQCDAVVVMRLAVGWLDRERPLERGRGGAAIAMTEMRVAERPPQRDVGRRALEPVDA